MTSILSFPTATIEGLSEIVRWVPHQVRGDNLDYLSKFIATRPIVTPDLIRGLF